MQSKLALTALAAAAVVLSSMPTFAHHAVQASVDINTNVEAKGVLTKVDWINPHTATWVDVKNPQSGEVEQWGCEGNPPATWHRAGLKKEDWKLGEMVTLTCAAAKDGSKHWGFIKMLKYKSDGRVMVFRIGGE